MRKAFESGKNVNALLNFKDDDESNMVVAKKPKQPKTVLKDKEGVDFYYYFTQKY